MAVYVAIPKDVLKLSFLSLTDATPDEPGCGVSIAAECEVIGAILKSWKKEKLEKLSDTT